MLWGTRVLSNSGTVTSVGLVAGSLWEFTSDLPLRVHTWDTVLGTRTGYTVTPGYRVPGYPAVPEYYY
eukprot:3019900-Rhodomonas_salina.1